MSADASNSERTQQQRRLTRAGALVALLAALTVAGMSWAYYFYYPRQLGPVQPIHFSHHLHVTEKQISCMFCHIGAIDTARAGLPATETCMLCHQHIITEYPDIRRLREQYQRNEPIQWARVNNLPDYVFFNHQVHVRRGFDCGRCHGDVAGMDRVRLVNDFTMGFCVQCHRDNDATHDCFACHR